MDDKEQTPFRIGGIYRDGYGDLCRIASILDGDLCQVECFCSAGWQPYAYPHRLSDGKYDSSADEPSKLHLIPGECDEHGNPLPTFTATLDRPAPTPKVKAALDLLEQGFKAQSEPKRVFVAQGDSISWHAADGSFHMVSSSTQSLGHQMREILERGRPVAKAAEPKRAPLDWNRPTPFDAFPGYQSRTINSSWAAPDSGKFADRRRDSAQVDPGHALAAVRQLVR